jgi:hypothetical protein
MPKRKVGEVILSDATAADIFSAVGVALSWWEASEDVLMGLFANLSTPRNGLAFKVYVAASRAQRQRLLRAAIDEYGSCFVGEEKANVLRELAELDKLAPVRNEIAHGHCSNVKFTEDDKLVMSGHFLLPSLNEGFRLDRSDHRYYHTVDTIQTFTQTVRRHRGVILDVDMALRIRWQESRMALDANTRGLLDLVEQIASGNIPHERVGEFIRRA